MGMCAYLIISDCHISAGKKENRVDWLNEIQVVLKEIESTIARYRGRGSVKLLFLGDVYDRSYSSVSHGIQDYSRMVVFRMMVDDVFVTLGNHEISYYTNNPFYSLIHTIESKKVQSHGIYQPIGLWNAVRIVDRLEDGDVVFHFNHYDTPISTPEKGKINIGLFHQEIVSPEILNKMEMDLGRIYAGRITDFSALTPVSGYQWCFFGHLHKVYGKWVYEYRGDECQLWYLGSLTRPNVSEVSDVFLERNIPAVLVEDGKFVGTEDNFFSLPSRKESVKEDVVKKQQQVYNDKKERAILRKTEGKEDPMQAIRSAVADKAVLASIVEGLENGPIDPLGTDLKKEVFRAYGLK